MKEYIAKVIDNNDIIDQEGKVQIYIESLHHDIITTYYPWARQDRPFTSDIPEIGDYVIVYFEDEKFYKNPFYKNKINLKEYHGHLDFSTTIQSNILGFSSIYPDVKFLKLKNDLTLAMSSNETIPEFAIYHPTGSYIFINTVGEIHIKSGTRQLEQVVLGTTLQTILSTILDALISHTHPTGTGPSGPPINASIFTTQKANMINPTTGILSLFNKIN